MRHDPASSALVIMLRSLKMYGMAQAVDELAQQGAPAFEAAIPILSQLLKAETAEREVRSMAYQLKVARFPVYRDLAGFDFSSSEVNEALVRQLHRCDFIEPVDNVVLVGGPGTGKTHIATALGVQAIEHHKKRARFFSTVELVNALEQEKAQGKAGQIASRLVHVVCHALSKFRRYLIIAKCQKGAKSKEAPQQFDAYQCPQFHGWDGKTNWQGFVSRLTEPTDNLSHTLRMSVPHERDVLLNNSTQQGG